MGLASGLSGSRGLNDIIGALSLSLGLSLLGGRDRTRHHEAHLWPVQQAQQTESLPPTSGKETQEGL